MTNEQILLRVAAEAVASLNVAAEAVPPYSALADRYKTSAANLMRAILLNTEIHDPIPRLAPALLPGAEDHEGATCD